MNDSHEPALAARRFNADRLVVETTEDPSYFEPFGRQPHADRISPHYKAEWMGFVDVPYTDRYRFTSLLGKNEQHAVWVDGHLLHTAGLKDSTSNSIELTAAYRHANQIEHVSPDGRAELKLLWSSRILDPTRLKAYQLHPAERSE